MRRRKMIVKMRIDREKLQEEAEVYKHAVDNGEGPHQAVANFLNISRREAKNRNFARFYHSELFG